MSLQLFDESISHHPPNYSSPIQPHPSSSDTSTTQNQPRATTDSHSLTISSSTIIDQCQSQVDYLTTEFDLAGFHTPNGFTQLIQSTTTSAGAAVATSPLTPTTVTLTPTEWHHVLDGMVEMWKERRKYQTQLQQSSHELDRLKSDLVHSNQRVTDLKDEKGELERKMWENEMKRRTSEKESLVREKNLKVELVNLDKKCVMIQRRDNQYKHELRKVEQNFEKIQEKLHKIILEKTSSTSVSGSIGSTQTKAAASNGSNGWEMTGSIKSVSRPNGPNNSSSSPSSADFELLQGTLATYSERMTQLVSENLALKSSLKQLESELQSVLNDETNLIPTNTNAPTDTTDATTSVTKATGGEAVAPSDLECLSPRTRTLLADFTPDMIELPWELSGENVEAALRGQMKLIKAKLLKQQSLSAAAAAEQQETRMIDLLKSKLQEQSEIIREQDVLLRRALYASDQDQLLANEQEDMRRLSLRVELEEKKHRRPNSTILGVNTNATNLPPPPATPATLKILGGHSATNLPILATPAYKSLSTQLSTRITSTIAPSSPPSQPQSKSKWLQGGIIRTPIFTPSRPSGQRTTVDEATQEAEEEETDEFDESSVLHELDGRESLEPVSLDFDL